jgi:hypothetical protein
MPSHRVPLNQVQGNVSPGFRKDHQAFLFFQFPDDTGTVASKGIMFLAYQARIDKGFEFVQDGWSTNRLFGRPAHGGEMPGVDPISVSTTRTNNRVIVPLRKGAAARDCIAAVGAHRHRQGRRLLLCAIANSARHAGTAPFPSVRQTGASDGGNRDGSRQQSMRRVRTVPVPPEIVAALQAQLKAKLLNQRPYPAPVEPDPVNLGAYKDEVTVILEADPAALVNNANDTYY